MFLFVLVDMILCAHGQEAIALLDSDDSDDWDTFSADAEDRIRTLLATLRSPSSLLPASLL